MMCAIFDALTVARVKFCSTSVTELSSKIEGKMVGKGPALLAVAVTVSVKTNETVN